MEKKKIEALLQKYYDAVSTPEEEEILIRYFEIHDVPHEWQTAKDQLVGVHDLLDADIPIPEGLEVGILSKLEAVQDQQGSKSLSLTKRAFFPILSAAASVVIIVTVLLFMNRQSDLGTYSDPDMAFAETKDALELVSKYFNQGTQELSQLDRMEQAAKPLASIKKVDEARKSLEYLGDFNKGLKTAKVLSLKGVGE
ncbi:MAG: hypothetical protein J7L96_11065 [Bacteroidales bacterium]|nr:hypothetical protein [Bacteroidales bacterium]